MSGEREICGKNSGYLLDEKQTAVTDIKYLNDGVISGNSL